MGLFLTIIGWLFVAAITISFLIWNIIIIGMTFDKKGKMEEKIDNIFTDLFSPKGTILYYLGCGSIMPAYFALKFLYWKPRLPFTKKASV